MKAVRLEHKGTVQEAGFEETGGLKVPSEAANLLESDREDAFGPNLHGSFAEHPTSRGDKSEGEKEGGGGQAEAKEEQGEAGNGEHEEDGDGEGEGEGEEVDQEQRGEEKQAEAEPGEAKEGPPEDGENEKTKGPSSSSVGGQGGEEGEEGEVGEVAGGDKAGGAGKHGSAAAGRSAASGGKDEQEGTEPAPAPAAPAPAPERSNDGEAENKPTPRPADAPPPLIPASLVPPLPNTLLGRIRRGSAAFLHPRKKSSLLSAPVPEGEDWHSKDLEILKLRTKAQKAELAKTELQADVSEMKVKVLTLESQCDAQDRVISRQQQKISAFDSVVVGLQADKADLEDTNKRLQAQLSELQSRLMRLDDDGGAHIVKPVQEGSVLQTYRAVQEATQLRNLFDMFSFGGVEEEEEQRQDGKKQESGLTSLFQGFSLFG